MAPVPLMLALQPTRCVSRWKRRLIASVALLLVLSALLGETEVSRAAAAPAMAASLDASRCSPGSNASGGAVELIGVGSGQPLAVAVHRAQPGPVRLVHALAGVPPWVIWPASPLPRIAGALLNPPLARTRIAVSAFTARDICASPDLDPVAPRQPGSMFGWPEPFSPLDRLAGVDQRFPRPPPNESR